MLSKNNYNVKYLFVTFFNKKLILVLLKLALIFLNIISIIKKSLIISNLIYNVIGRKLLIIFEAFSDLVKIVTALTV